MLALGIDPGTAICGYGFVESRGSNLIAHKYGAITTSPKAKMEDRLLKIFDGLNEMIKEFKPDVMGIEQLFFNRNVTTAITVGQARGVIILAAAQLGVKVNEYTPLQVKQAVVGYGRAEKAQVMDMVKRICHLPTPPKPDDAADAVALALCHACLLYTSPSPRDS